MRHDLSSWPRALQGGIALAALFSAAQRVHEIANGRSGRISDEALDKMLRAASIERQPDDWNALLPEPALLLAPLERAIELLRGRSPERQILMYVLQLIMLAERLQQQHAIRTPLETLLDRCDSAAPEALADIYQATISKLGHRIQVTGHPQTLNDPVVAAQIRALLLSGVRFAWLWRSLGGRRRHLVLGRRRIINTLASVQGQLK